MNTFEIAFLFLALASALAMFIKVGFDSNTWSEFYFVFAYVTCATFFIQFIIRYIGVTYVANTETTVQAWATSFAILVVGLITVQLTTSIEQWFLSFGILLLLAHIKTRQTRNSIRSKDAYPEEIKNRLKEYSIAEIGQGILMILFFILLNTEFRAVLRLSDYCIYFFGTFCALYYGIIAFVINVDRLVRNRATIEEKLNDEKKA